MTSNGGYLYQGQYDNLVAGRFGVEPDRSIWSSTIIEEDFNHTQIYPVGESFAYFNPWKPEYIKGKRINNLMNWFDQLVIYHRLHDSNYSPSGLDVGPSGY